MKEYSLGQLAELKLSVVPSAFIGTLILWLGLSGMALAFLFQSLPQAMVVGGIAVVLHWASETAHQWGHATAARPTGYPMSGIRYWGVLSTSVYPRDEAPLPGQVHIRRALGGPVASLIVALISGLVFLALNAISANSIASWLALFVAVENLLVFCLGAFLPLGFTDGSTILRWWKHK